MLTPVVEREKREKGGEKKGGGGRREGGEEEKEKRAKEERIKKIKGIELFMLPLGFCLPGGQENKRWEQNFAFNEFTTNGTTLLSGLAGTRNKRGLNSPSHQSLDLAYLKRNNCQRTLALFCLGPSSLAGRCENV